MIRKQLIFALSILLVSACSEKKLAEGPTLPEATTTTMPVIEKIVAVGDIACSESQKVSASNNECKEEDVAALTRSINPDSILLLGDVQYNSGQLSDFQSTFKPLWNDMLNISIPTPGNHEYASGGDGFYDFFDFVPKTGYYKTELQNVSIISINTNCEFVAGGCGDGSEQSIWLEDALANAQSSCVIVFGHHPRFSNGQKGDNPSIGHLYSIMEKYGVELYLSGDDHNYERIDGTVTQIVSGTGGRSLRPAQNVIAEYGVVELDISKDSITGKFVTVNDEIKDSFTKGCN